MWDRLRYAFCLALLAGCFQSCTEQDATLLAYEDLNEDQRVFLQVQPDGIYLLAGCQQAKNTRLDLLTSALACFISSSHAEVTVQILPSHMQHVVYFSNENDTVRYTVTNVTEIESFDFSKYLPNQFSQFAWHPERDGSFMIISDEITGNRSILRFLPGFPP